MSSIAVSAPSVLPASAAALASACGFAFSTSLQHRVAGSAPESVRGTAGLLRYVSTKPSWVLGVIAGGGAMALHALALRLGAIALVQPVMVSGVVLAVPVRAALDRRGPSGLELWAVSVTAVGLALFLVAARPHDASGAPDLRTASVLTVVAVLAAGVTMVVASRVRRASSRALLLGATAGVMFGLTATMTKLIVTNLDPADIAGTVGTWPPWALLGAGACGMAINQRAYQIAPLSVSMPMVNIVNVMLALTFGWTVFGEAASHDSLALATQALALVCMAAGLRLVGRSTERPGARTEAAAHHSTAGRP